MSAISVKESNATDDKSARLETADWFLRCTLVVNLTLFALTFVPAFSGFGPQHGIADRWWGGIRLFGWRADVVWMLFSTAILFAGALRSSNAHTARRTTSTLCRIWIACFVVYLGYVVIHMFG